MVTFQERKLLIDGKEICLISGEIHYFRIPRKQWQSMLDEAKDMGLNCIASYVPWILHEEQEGIYDFEDNLDLEAFLELCQENGFYFFLRPGPFIMAEMKNEGIPYWIYEKYPQVSPVSYDGMKPATDTLDYLNPDYLEACRRWYRKIFSVVNSHLQPNGGNIIGVQLDNEVGMLNWVTNTPVMNQSVINRFIDYLKNSYSRESLAERYPFPLTEKAASYFRSPQPEYEIPFHQDWNRYMRNYYKEYLLQLKSYAVEAGVNGVPFFINIHGTGGGRIYDFPLGISQLADAYNDGGCISGSDVYLGEPSIGNYQDTYVANAYQAAFNKKGQPAAAIEFECSDGPYCSRNQQRYHPSGTQHRLIMHLAQDNRMVNFYVFCGGVNGFLKHPRPDGNERMAFTNTFHGFSAPVEPDGHRNYSFDTMKDTVQCVKAINEFLADYEQQTDNVALGIILDYFLTETVYEKSEKTREIYRNLKKFRCQDQIDGMIRALLNENINFKARDIQGENLDDIENLVLLSARYMPAECQQKLVHYVRGGGHLMLYGEIPHMDMEGNECRILLDELGVGSPEYLKSDFPVYLTVREEGRKDISDYVIEEAQCFAKDDSALLSVYKKDLMCAFEKQTGSGRVTAVTCAYPCEMDFYKKIFREAGIYPKIKVEYYRFGNFASLSEGKDGGKLLFLCNLDAVEKNTSIQIEGQVWLGQFSLAPKEGLILPVNLKKYGVTIVKSTAQIMKWERNCIRFRLTQKEDCIIISADRKILSAAGYRTENDLVCSMKDSELMIQSGDTPDMVMFCPNVREFPDRNFEIIFESICD